MDVYVVIDYFVKYGMIFIFIMVFLEYLNLPGFPAGVIMPAAGLIAARGTVGFIPTLFITVLAGLVGSILLYLFGSYGGDFFFKKYYKKFPKQKELIENKMDYLREKGSIGIFVSKLIPVIRTLISIPAGAIKMNMAKYIISSTLGITLWNSVFVGAGYVLGEKVLVYIS